MEKETITNKTVHPEERKRLSNQCHVILNCLLDGNPWTNVGLVKASKSMSLPRRISDLREYLEPEGKTIKIVQRCRKTGVNHYQIVDLEPSPPVIPDKKETVMVEDEIPEVSYVGPEEEDDDCWDSDGPVNLVSSE